jgi:hypothetical protein
MDVLKQARLQAKNLRLEVAALGAPVPLTDDQALALAARANGFDSWQAMVQSHRNRYFHTRHTAYLPNTIELVRALSVRRAAIEDLADMEARMAGASEQWSGQWVVAQAAERALRQARTAVQEGVAIHPDLMDAVVAGVSGDLVELWRVESDAKQSLLHGFGNDAYLQSRGLPYQALSVQSAAQAEQYHAAYLRWRLAAMSVALCAVCDRKEGLSFADMLSGWESQEVFAYAGALVLNQLGNLATMDVPALTHLRSVGKTVLLNVQASGCMEPSLLSFGSMALPNANALVSRLLERFPEIVFWHAWVELKPMLAEGIDDIIP